MSEQTFRFCPVCGSPFEPRVLRVGEPSRLVCTGATCGFVFYLDPKVAVGTIITRPDRHVVLVRRAIDPGYGKWVFPGGYVDRGEEVTLAAIREADATTRDIWLRTSRSADGTAEVAIDDTGAGVTAAAAGRLYEPFFTTKPDGMGMGLAICLTIAEMHQGRIAV